MAGSIGSSSVDGGRGRQQPTESGTRRKARISMPLTAMIDVTFLLLIYFLLTTTFRQPEGQLPGTLPGRGDGDPPSVIRLHLRALGADCESVVYTVGGASEPLRSPQELVDSLQARRERMGKDVLVVIQAGRAVRWRYVVEACNQAARANCQSTIRI